MLTSLYLTNCCYKLVDIYTNNVKVRLHVIRFSYVTTCNLINYSAYCLPYHFFLLLRYVERIGPHVVSIPIC